MSELLPGGPRSVREEYIHTGQWQPLFQGDEARTYRDVVQEITVSLESSDAMQGDGSLAGGQAGLALLFAYRHLVTGSDQDLQNAVAHLNTALESDAASSAWPGLYAGLPGIGYAATFLHRRLLGREGDDPVDEVDEVVESLLEVSRWEGDYDLVGGLVGLGVYALERLPDQSGRKCLIHIINHLESLAIPQKVGIAWWTPPERMSSIRKERSPGGYLNLGVAHGIPGVIALLGHAVHIGILPEKSRALLNGAVAWMMSQRLPPDSPSVFPAWVPVGSGKLPLSRVAWCYGDIGIAAVLLSVARMLGNESWESQAVRVALHSASVPVAESGAVDAGLCHGSAGIAHLFNRMFQATGEPALGDAARFWFRNTLTRRRPGEGVAGFCSYSPRLAGRNESPWRTKPGFLEGAAGVALAFLAATTDQDPVWDDVLLCGMRQGEHR